MGGGLHWSSWEGLAALGLMKVYSRQAVALENRSIGLGASKLGSVCWTKLPLAGGSVPT